MRGKQAFDLSTKLIVIGDSGVGKTNMVLNFVDEKFKDNYVATIGVDFKIKTILTDGKRIRLQIWDTAGQQRYRNITEAYYKNAAGIILAYAINDRASFNNLCTGIHNISEKWILQISQKAPVGIKKIIVGTKCDLEEERVITFEEGQKLAEYFSNQTTKIPFMEVSAKTSRNVEEAFQALAEIVKQELQKQLQNKSVLRIVTSKPQYSSQNRCAC